MHLTIETNKIVSEDLLDSLQINNTHNNYLSLKKETDILRTKFENIGFIENKLVSLQKKNDSSYVANFFLGRRFQSLSIHYSKDDFTKKELSQISQDVTETHFILPFNTIEKSLQDLNKLKTLDGNAFARIHLEDILKENNVL